MRTSNPIVMDKDSRFYSKWVSFMNRFVACSPKVYPLHDFSWCWQPEGCASAVIPLQNILSNYFYLFMAPFLAGSNCLNIYYVSKTEMCSGASGFCIKILKCDTVVLTLTIAGSCSNLTPDTGSNIFRVSNIFY